MQLKKPSYQFLTDYQSSRPGSDGFDKDLAVYYELSKRARCRRIYLLTRLPAMPTFTTKAPWGKSSASQRAPGDQDHTLTLFSPRPHVDVDGWGRNLECRIIRASRVSDSPHYNL